MTTKKVVSDEILGGIAREQADLFRRVREGTLDPHKVSDGLQALIEGRFAGSTPAFRFDKRNNGWTLVEDEGSQLSASGLEIVPFLKRGESYVSGEAMRERAKELDANFGQHQAEYLLEHQAEIPAKWRNYYLVFPGTLWRDSRGDLLAPFLRWSGDQWYLRFFWLDYVWDSRDRVLRLRK